MAALSLAFYRVPADNATQVGSVKVVRDRHGQLYLAGSKVVEATPSGAFLALTLASGAQYIVRAHDYDALRQPAAPAAPSKTSRRRR